jgi:penicillin-binding protein 2
LSHILGYTGKISEAELSQANDEYLPIDYIGKMGLEYFWESDLKGKNGRKQIEVDALGKEKKIISQEAGRDGFNLVISIDTGLQIKLEEILTDYLTRHRLNRASGIVMDPNNGEIKALVSLPSYNNNLFARGITREEYGLLISHPDKPLYNRAISGEYPSGSTIKPVWAAAALEEGIINERTSFLSVGGIRIGEWFFPDWKAGGHGTIDVRRALARRPGSIWPAKRAVFCPRRNGRKKPRASGGISATLTIWQSARAIFWSRRSRLPLIPALSPTAADFSGRISSRQF